MRLLLILIGIFFGMTANAANFEISSTSFRDNGPIATQYTCDGGDTSPTLSWSNSPAKTRSFVLIVSDPDAPSGVWYHWVVYNIPANATEFTENKIPSGSVVGKNSFEKTTYNGPCPPPGKKHHYIFTLYALNTKLNLTSADAPTLLQAMQGHVLESAQVIGIFKK